MANQFASPNITVKEIDLSGVVPAVDTSTGAFVGNFNWGPVEQPVLIANEAKLAEVFGAPNLVSDTTSIDFLTAAYFLKYASTLYVVRTQEDALNAAISGAEGGVAAVTISGTNDNYTDTPSISFSGGGGSGATAFATMEIESIVVGAAGGLGYAVNDTFQIDIGTGTNAVGRVDTVTAGGVVTAITLLSSGSFTGTLDALTNHATILTDGSGDNNLQVTATVAIKSITITDTGSGYTSAPTATESEGGNATLTVVFNTDGVLVKNEAAFDTLKSGLGTEQIIAKYPGTAGNSLQISFCPASGGDTAFNAWTVGTTNVYEEFDAAPSTSSYVSNLGGTNDEVHVAVIDEDGVFTGVPGTVLETFAYASLAGDAKTSDGSSNYVLDVLNAKSNYVWAADVVNFTELGDASSGFVQSTTTVQTFSLSGGVASNVLDPGDIDTGFDSFEDPETITVDFLIAPGMTSTVDQTAVVTNLEGIARGLRKDCVVVASPSRDDVLNQSTVSNIADAIEAFSNSLTSSSYLVLDNNYLKVYDKYNDAYVFIPASSSTAGLMALTDQNAAPWFSPAGQRRGLYLGVTSLAWNAAREYRDQLYKVGVNPVVNLPGQGILLYGDKTKEARPSAFDRINVRRLFLLIERSIKQAASNVLFEFNDEFTRAEFVNIVEPFLREIQGRRGITDFRVVCDETNNTAAVIDANRFIASIFIKPARSINFITLNFVAVRTGVDFEEVVGRV